MQDIKFLALAIRTKFEQARALAKEGGADRGAISLELAVLIACLLGLGITLAAVALSKATEKNAVITGQ
ncbi:hypothetical protein ACFRMQ_00545 [Kitasatospora sp. NPDC056783]|uniref:hypothetical protein n=1 Tax=Kitasatospora sp. NPDC056783 TaxID=3345943 RepID=UPI00369B28DA